jgi:hypothetical protein
VYFIKNSSLYEKSGAEIPPRLLLVLFTGSDQSIDLSQQSITIHTVNHAGLLNSLTAGSGAAQAVHADGQEQGCGLGGDVQDVTDDGVLSDSHDRIPPFTWDMGSISYPNPFFNGNLQFFTFSHISGGQ